MGVAEPEAGAAQTADGWDRYFAVLLPFVLLGLATVVGLLASLFGGLAATPELVTLQLVLVAVVAAWMWWWTIAHPAWRADRPRMAVHYLGRTALAFALTWVNPFFAVFAFVGYTDADVAFRGRAAYGALLVTAVTMAGSQSGGLPPKDAAQWVILGALVVLNAGLAGLFMRFHNDVTGTSERRAVVIAELERLNAELETALADNAALQQRVVEQARSAGVQEERARLAREIHDGLAQSLAGIVAQLQAAQHDLADPAVATRVRRATVLAREGLADARRSVAGLAPAPLASRTLPEAVADLVASWEAHHEPKADLVVTGAPRPLHPEVEAAVLRVAQEALANVAKHAAATRVGVTLSYAEDEVILDVRDDGTGFDPSRSAPQGSFGLRGMRQRTGRLAGTLDVESAPGHGTAVSARLPALERGAA